MSITINIITTIIIIIANNSSSISSILIHKFSSSCYSFFERVCIFFFLWGSTSNVNL